MSEIDDATPEQPPAVPGAESVSPMAPNGVDIPVPSVQPTGASKPKSNAGLIIGVLAVIAVLGMVVIGAIAYKVLVKPKHTINGTFLLEDLPDGSGDIDPSITSSSGREGAWCEGTGGYRDMQEGENVTIKDSAGSLIGTASFVAGVVPVGGTLADHVEMNGYDIDVAVACEFRFTLNDIPDSEFYELEIGHRGKQTFEKAELERDGWKVDLSLGD